MIAKISRGADIKGLVRYAFGLGRHEEHRDQRVIAAGSGVAVPIGVALDAGEVAALGAELDLSRAVHGTVVTRRARAADGATEVVPAGVWHLSLSNPAGDRRLDDREWAEIAGDVMDRLGFSGSGRSPCPWVAIAHGASAAGNDHIHLAVSLVREDGTAASTWQDRVKVSAACAAYERRYGLAVVAGREDGTMPTPGRAEIEAAHRRGRPEPERSSLARAVRAAAVASRDEAEFVRRLRGGGVLVRPYYAKGSGREVVAGYSVALPPVGTGAEGKPVWYGGGRLAVDLRLPALRAGWGITDEAAAVSEWNRPGPAPAGRETKQWPVGAWAEAATQTEAVWRSLAGVAVDDRAGWAAGAADASGVLAGLAGRLEVDGPGPLCRAADALANAAQLRPEARSPRPGRGDLRGVAAVAAQAAMSGGPAAWALLMAELVRMAKAIEAAARARDVASGAAQNAAAARAALEEVHARYALAGRLGDENPGRGRSGPLGAVQRAPGPRPRPPGRPGLDDERRGGFER